MDHTFIKPLSALIRSISDMDHTLLSLYQQQSRRILVTIYLRSSGPVFKFLLLFVSSDYTMKMGS